jgi:fucose permease
VTPVLYVVAGASFALMKVSVYSTIGLITKDQRGHTSLMNMLEGMFQVGSLTGPLLFSFMIATSHWNHTYWLLAGLGSLALVLMLLTPLDEGSTDAAAGEGAEQPGLGQMLGLLRVPMVWLFVLAAWLYVMIEQSFNTWLPTFNREVFHLSDARAAALLGIFPASIAVSRFLTGYLARRFSWLTIQLVFLACACLITVLVVVATIGGAPQWSAWLGAHPLAWLFALVGFFLGPIYPTISSIVLSRLEKIRHSAMTGLIIIFSAMGGTTGSMLIGLLSQRWSTHDAFFFPLLPMVLLALVLIPYRRVSDRFGHAHGTV